MHSKMIQIDGATTFVGSVNFSINSLTKARELGVIFANAPAAAAIAPRSRPIGPPRPPPEGSPTAKIRIRLRLPEAGSGV